MRMESREISRCAGTDYMVGHLDFSPAFKRVTLLGSQPSYIRVKKPKCHVFGERRANTTEWKAHQRQPMSLLATSVEMLVFEQHGAKTAQQSGANCLSACRTTSGLPNCRSSTKTDDMLVNVWGRVIGETYNHK